MIHEIARVDNRRTEAACTCGLVDRPVVVEAHVRAMAPVVRCFPGCPHTPDEPNCSRQPSLADLGEDIPHVVGELPISLARRLQKVAIAYPYAVAVMSRCPSCVRRFPRDWPTDGYGLDLLVLFHSSHRVAEHHAIHPEDAA